MLQAGVAENLDATITSAIISVLSEFKDMEGNPKWVKFWPISNRKSWGRKYGSSNVTRTKKSMIEEGTLEEEMEEPVEKGDKPKRTGRVKLRC
jgi:hypothetical protein